MNKQDKIKQLENQIKFLRDKLANAGNYLISKGLGDLTARELAERPEEVCKNYAQWNSNLIKAQRELRELK